MKSLTGTEIAEGWARWCGETKWVKLMREFGKLGGKSTWYCGFPQSASAIPLCFTLIAPSGQKLECQSRLKDIKNAISNISKERGI